MPSTNVKTICQPPNLLKFCRYIQFLFWKARIKTSLSFLSLSYISPVASLIFAALFAASETTPTLEIKQWPWMLTRQVLIKGRYWPGWSSCPPYPAFLWPGSKHRFEQRQEDAPKPPQRPLQRSIEAPYSFEEAELEGLSPLEQFHSAPYLTSPEASGRSLAAPWPLVCLLLSSQVCSVWYTTGGHSTESENR